MQAHCDIVHKQNHAGSVQQLSDDTTVYQEFLSRKIFAICVDLVWSVKFLLCKNCVCMTSTHGIVYGALALYPGHNLTNVLGIRG